MKSPQFWKVGAFKNKRRSKNKRLWTENSPGAVETLVLWQVPRVVKLSEEMAAGD